MPTKENKGLKSIVKVKDNKKRVSIPTKSKMEEKYRSGGSPLERYQYALFSPLNKDAAQPGICMTREELLNMLNEWGSYGWEFPNAVIVSGHSAIGDCYRLETPGSVFLIGRRKLSVSK